VWELLIAAIDADENVDGFGSRVPRSNVFYITGTVSMDPNSQLWKSDLNINLDLAVIGLGQLNTQHHYFRDHNELQLKAMSTSIRKLIEWQSNNPELLDSIAEIVLRLYPAGSKPLPEEFLDVIHETNNTILAVPPDKIRKAGEIMLIAGGSQKINALHGILTGRFPEAPIDKKNLTLVTDSWTAETILQKLSQRPRK
jgi:hypothetical protein